MKVRPRRGAPLGQAAHKEDTTAEIEAGAPNQVLRRTTVTVERETVSVLMRRTVTAPAVSFGEDPAALDGEVDAPRKHLQAASRATRNEPSEGKP
jgi:Arc/MetJ family transcription regulator